ncbi:hypothetical protein J2S15_000168 [Breznakia pachnodae]|uniref:Uncharacterized protein n=1 Tax=Breznakia pachnodae TaxID=265178 RepID=A0ABU0DXT3_9FIRM|nr:hypothetical protein [Breznakia pachnodae]
MYENIYNVVIDMNDENTTVDEAIDYIIELNK